MTICGCKAKEKTDIRVMRVYVNTRTVKHFDICSRLIYIQPDVPITLVFVCALYRSGIKNVFAQVTE